MDSFQFQSLTTEAFLDFLKAELPEVFEKVDVHQWIYKPGLPEEWHRPKSHLYEDIQQVLKDYDQGIRPTKEQVHNWHRYQILSFLQGLPEKYRSKIANTSMIFSSLKRETMSLSFLSFMWSALGVAMRRSCRASKNLWKRLGACYMFCQLCAL